MDMESPQQRQRRRLANTAQTEQEGVNNNNERHSAASTTRTDVTVIRDDRFAELEDELESMNGNTYELAIFESFIKNICKYPFGDYFGKELPTLYNIKVTVYYRLSEFISSRLYSFLINSFTSGSSSEELLRDLLREERTESVLFYNHMKEYCHSRKDVESICNSWMSAFEAVNRSYRKFKTCHIIPLPSKKLIRQQRKVISDIKTFFVDDPIKQDIVQKYIEISKDGQPVYPFIVMCAASGSGKTTLAMSLCCDEVPSIYLLFPLLHSDIYRQNIYKPYQNMSDLFLDLIISDLKKKKFRMSNVERLSPDFFRNYHLNTKLKFVGAIVELYKALILLKTNNNTWLQCQCQISSFSKKPMSINQALVELASIRRRYNNKPLRLFFDECSTGNDLDREKRLVYVRSTTRDMNLVLNILGTEAAASNFITSVRGDSSNSTEYHAVEWAVIVNVMPSFDRATFDRKVADLRTTNQQPALRTTNRQPTNRQLALNQQLAFSSFIQFLQSIIGNELPYFIKYSLNESSTYATRIASAPLEILNSLLLSVFNMFHKKKIVTNVSSFNVYQFKYLLHYCWQPSIRPTTQGKVVRYVKQSDSVINHHVGYLFGYPRVPSKAYFSLRLCLEDRAYLTSAHRKAIKTINRINRIRGGRTVQESSELRAAQYVINNMNAYHPRGVFSAFSDCPLTGLVLSGITCSHPTFTDKFGKRLTTFNAIITSYDTIVKGKGSILPKPTNGALLETLCHLSVVTSSRCGEVINNKSNAVHGVGGCTGENMLKCMVRELSAVFTDTLPIIELPSDDFMFYFDRRGRKFPMVSPMSFVPWSDATVEMLKKHCVRSSIVPVLGTFEPSIGNESADLVVRYQDINQTADYFKFYTGIYTS